MTTAITIGSYRLFDFVKLNVAMCRRVFDDPYILISDDLSHWSPEIKAFAEDSGCAYLCSPSRRSHFGGDLTALIHSVVFAASTEADYSLKLSQRMVPIAPGFREALEREMSKPEVKMCVPGQPLHQQIARPSAAFYAKLGTLSDAIAIRTGAITGERIRDIYAEAFASARSRNDSLIEVVVARIEHDCFPNGQCVKIPEWTNHVPFKAKLYLRKSQSTQSEYEKAAAEAGIEGVFDLREWIQIERENYLCRPSCV